MLLWITVCSSYVLPSCLQGLARVSWAAGAVINCDAVSRYCLAPPMSDTRGATLWKFEHVLQCPPHWIIQRPISLDLAAKASGNLWKRERARFLHQLERDIFQAKFTKHGMYSRKIYKKCIMKVRVTWKGAKRVASECNSVLEYKMWIFKTLILENQKPTLPELVVGSPITRDIRLC